MTNPTSNYNFQMPTATDLVTDLPADFEVFGQAVDTRLKALQPGTTAGDLAYSSATANTNTRLAIGTAGQILAVNSGATAPQWVAAPTGGATNWTFLNSGNTALTGAGSVTFSSLSAKELLILIARADSASASSLITLRFNSDSGTNYANFGFYNIAGTTYSRDNFFQTGTNFTSTSVTVAKNANDAGSIVTGSVYVDQAAQTGYKRFAVTAGFDGGGGSNAEQYATQGLYNGSAAITSVTILSSVGNFDGGNVYIYGAN